MDTTRSLCLLHSQHKNTDSVYGTQWENLYQIVNNPDNLSIYTLDLSQGSFIVPEAYNSGLKWIMFTYMFLLNKTSEGKPNVQFLPVTLLPVLRTFYRCENSVIRGHADDIILFL